MRLSFFVPVALLGLGAFGCGSSDPQANVPPGGATGYPPGYPAPTQTVPVQTATAPQQPVTVGGAATPVSIGMLGPAAAVLAAGSPDTKGMTAEGSAFAGQFQQGQVLEQPFNIEPNKCYTVVGIGGPGISELDVQIQYVTPFPTPPIAQDNQTGPNATLGGGGSCWRSQPLTAVPGKVIIRATGGAGIAGAQIFKK